MGNTCARCAPGSVPVGAVCEACGAKEVSVGAQCVACPLGQGPDRATNTCVACPADATLDWGTLSDPACGTRMAVESTTSGDVCPNEFWVAVTNLNVPSTTSRTSDYFISADLVTDLSTEQPCLASEVAFTVAENQGGPGLASIGDVLSSDPQFCEESSPNPELFLCGDQYCTHAAAITLPLAQVAAGRNAVRVLASGNTGGAPLPAKVTVRTTGCAPTGGPQ